LLLVSALPPALVTGVGWASYGNFDFSPLTPRLGDGSEEIFIASSSWMYSWARDKTSLIWVRYALGGACTTGE